MFGLFKSPAARQAEAAQKQAAQPLQFMPVNDDATEGKYQHNYFGRKDAEETAG